MAVGQLGRAGHKRNVQPISAKLHEGIARRSLRHLDLNAEMVFKILLDQFREEAVRDQGMSVDAEAAAFPGCRHVLCALSGGCVATF